MTVQIAYSLAQINAIVHGKFVGEEPAQHLKFLLLDSRKLAYPGQTIFFALGPDANKNALFISDLLQKGVRAFVVKNNFTPEKLAGASYIFVDDPLQALQALAVYHRQNVVRQTGGKALKVIGITGSNGKTVVKEWLNLLLAPGYNIVRSPKSYNSQVGVPLSVLQIEASNDLAIFEAGISQTGEMANLEKMIRPDIGIFTNIGTSHDEGFMDTGQKIREKLGLFVNAQLLIFNSDNGLLLSSVTSFANDAQHPGSTRLFSWARYGNATLLIRDTEKRGLQTLITAEFENKFIQISIPFTDDASIENAITCWCVMLFLKISNAAIQQRMLQLMPIEMRLELKEGINNCLIINDSYSSDVHSLSLALDFLKQQQQHVKHTVILSDILQSGKPNQYLYAEVAGILQEKKITRLVGIGPAISEQRSQFDFLQEKDFYGSVKDFRKSLAFLHFRDETILIKGARAFKFEKINKWLEKKIHQTILSINLDALAHNLKEYRRMLQPSTRIMAMVKAFGYGSGSMEVARVLEFQKVDYLAVAYADEGVELRKAGITLPVMVMNADENSFDTMVEHQLEPEIYSMAILSSFEKYLLSSGIDNFPVHLKLDTGMHRLGFDEGDIPALCQRLKNNKKVKVCSVFSHLVASEDADADGFTLHQANVFLKNCQLIHGATGYDFIKHLANTSGISRHPELQLDMVRLGIGLYGIDDNQPGLQNVSTLTTTVAQLKNVKPGDTVGYGRKAVITSHSRIATVRIGYADGYPRNLGHGKGKMLFNGILVPVVGNVCMDMTMLDVTAVKSINEGDEIIVFGKELRLQTLATWSATIPYEIMTGISQRVKRVYFQD